MIGVGIWKILVNFFDTVVVGEICVIGPCQNCLMIHVTAKEQNLEMVDFMIRKRTNLCLLLRYQDFHSELTRL